MDISLNPSLFFASSQLQASGKKDLKGWAATAAERRAALKKRRSSLVLLSDGAAAAVNFVAQDEPSNSSQRNLLRSVLMLRNQNAQKSFTPEAIEGKKRLQAFKKPQSKKEAIRQAWRDSLAPEIPKPRFRGSRPAPPPVILRGPEPHYSVTARSIKSTAASVDIEAWWAELQRQNQGKDETLFDIRHDIDPHAQSVCLSIEERMDASSAPARRSSLRASLDMTPAMATPGVVAGRGPFEDVFVAIDSLRDAIEYGAAITDDTTFALRSHFDHSKVTEIDTYVNRDGRVEDVFHCVRDAKLTSSSTEEDRVSESDLDLLAQFPITSTKANKFGSSSLGSVGDATTLRDGPSQLQSTPRPPTKYQTCPSSTEDRTLTAKPSRQALNRLPTPGAHAFQNPARSGSGAHGSPPAKPRKSPHSGAIQDDNRRLAVVSGGSKAGKDTAQTGSGGKILDKDTTKLGSGGVRNVKRSEGVRSDRVKPPGGYPTENDESVRGAIEHEGDDDDVEWADDLIDSCGYAYDQQCYQQTARAGAYRQSQIHPALRDNLFPEDEGLGLRVEAPVITASDPQYARGSNPPITMSKVLAIRRARTSAFKEEMETRKDESDINLLAPPQRPRPPIKASSSTYSYDPRDSSKSAKHVPLAPRVDMAMRGELKHAELSREYRELVDEPTSVRYEDTTAGRPPNTDERKGKKFSSWPRKKAPPKPLEFISDVSKAAEPTPPASGQVTPAVSISGLSGLFASAFKPYDPLQRLSGPSTTSLVSRSVSRPSAPQSPVRSSSAAHTSFGQSSVPQTPATEQSPFPSQPTSPEGEKTSFMNKFTLTERGRKPSKRDTGSSTSSASFGCVDGMRDPDELAEIYDEMAKKRSDRRR